MYNRQYTVLLYDKSLIQAEFLLEGNEIVKERLVFMKKHNKIWDQEEIEISDAFDEDWFSDEVGIPIVLRVDYDPKEHKECSHAVTHLTLSNHDCCRIPVKDAITFSDFVRFVLFHFYDITLEMPVHRIESNYPIAEEEKKMLHINWISQN